MALHIRRNIALIAVACVGFAGCASAGGGDKDGSISAIPDADPNAPDADPNAPDANPNAPDANMSLPPDAMVNTAPDASSTCPKTPCHLVDQCGCTSPLVCDLDFTSGTTLGAGDTRCRAVIQPGTDLATCASADECAGGYVCIGGQCRKYCDPANDTCPGAGGKCIVGLNYMSAPIPGATTCTKNCIPTEATPAGCPTGYGCHVSIATGDIPITDCEQQVATGGDGASCTTNGNADCTPGFDCITISGNAVCKQVCVLSGGSGPACATGTCSGLSVPNVIGGVEYGICN